MTVHTDINLHVVEIRHNGPTIQFKVDTLEDYVSGVVYSADGKPHSFDDQAKELSGLFERLGYTGVEAQAVTITLPPISLASRFQDPSVGNNLTLGAVCDTRDLFKEVKASGGVGAIFTAQDVINAVIKEKNEDYMDLSEEEKAEFIKAHSSEFLHDMEKHLTEEGTNHLGFEVNYELWDVLNRYAVSKGGPSI